MHPRALHENGFSLIELSLVFAIAGLLLVVGITGFVSFSKREALDAGAAAIAGGLRDARAQTLASVGGSQYGIQVESTGFTLFKGSTYVAGATGNDTFFFSSFLRASSSLSSFVFQRITGNAAGSGIIELYLVSDPTTKRTITVGSTGLVDVE